MKYLHYKTRLSKKYNFRINKKLRKHQNHENYLSRKTKKIDIKQIDPNVLNITTSLEKSNFQEEINDYSRNSTEIYIDKNYVENDRAFKDNSSSSDEEFYDLFECCDSFSDTDGEEEKESKKESEHEYIFKGSRLNVKEFRNSFLWLCQKLEMKKGDRKILLDYIKFLLPAPNNIPNSYHLIIKQAFKKKQMRKKVFKICSECYGSFEKVCENPNCVNGKKRKWIDAMVFDFGSQIQRITEKNWNKIQHYKCKL